MKKILIVTAVFFFILLLAKIANQIPPPAPPGYDFWLYAQQVVKCSATEITLTVKAGTKGLGTKGLVTKGLLDCGMLGGPSALRALGLGVRVQ